ncbi:sugar-binding transcriptional regulator [Chengkuizengella sp. SCS-71B]|uniref:sugar-binding transcriptional regulator n=1 Tax=Chengkuizengella sp. SCS-71B TaxID=3115290 RepID=UPI0032C2128E
MRKILDIQKQLLPDLTEVLNKRYTILHHILLSGVVGRRTLASSLNMTERVLRAEVNFLKEQGLLEIETIGMRISDSGKELIEQLRPIMKELLGLTDLEEQIQNRYGLKQVVIVPGDSDFSDYSKKELGRAGAAMLLKYAAKEDIIAVAGGSTTSEIANQLSASTHLKGNLFVPARGGLGEMLELQANTIASSMAKRTGAGYRLLHVPDHLSEDAYQSLIQEPNIKEIIDVIRKSRMVVHGIGEAMVMADRRKVDHTTRQILESQRATAEAFGYYFNHRGEVVHQIPTIGLRIEDIVRTEFVIGVAGGSSKAEAILSVLKFGHEDVLVIDEGAATKMVEIM